MKALQNNFRNSIICLCILAFVASIFAQNIPPKARVSNVTDDYFGIKIVDPYRWLEDLKAQETQDWMKSQAIYTDAYLKRLPMRDEILKRLTEVTGASIAVRDVRRRGNFWFYVRRAPDEQDFKLYVGENLTGAERLLIDPNTVLKDGKRYSLGGWNSSWDGRYVAYQISSGGAESGEIRVVEAATGKDLGERIDRVQTGSMSWLPNGRSFLYRRLQKLPDGATSADKYKKMRVYHHVLGTNSADDRAVFGFDVNPKISSDEIFFPSVETDPNWDFAIAKLTDVSSNKEFYAVPLQALNQAKIPWRKIVSFDDGVPELSVRGDDLYLQTSKNAPRYKIVRTSFAKPDLAKAETVFSGDEAVIESLMAQRDALYIKTLAGGSRRIWRVNYKTKKTEPLMLPYEGSVDFAATTSDTDGIYFNLVSWTKSNAHFRYDSKTAKSTPTNLIPPNPVDMSGIEFVNAKAKSYDGTLVPLVIIHKKGLKRDGTNPTLMNGYGAYGYENTSATFDTITLPWIERGGVYVWTGVRGGGEYGEEWYRAGFQKTKPNSWKDFIACAEYLIEEKYTSPKHLGIEGGSAGGVLISNTIAERPELFGAAYIAVGITNVLREESTPGGVPNIPEFGSYKTEEGFKNLLAMDGYHKIKDGVKYPAVLLTHGINDPRVEPWMSAKMAARLQAATSSSKPVLLRLDYDAGHGAGSTKEQRNAEFAEVFAFLFQQLGTANR